MADLITLTRFKSLYYKFINKKVFIGFGNLTFRVDAFGKNGFFFSDKEQMHEFLVNNIERKDLVILKGSRGMQMEQFINTQRGDS